MRWFDPTACDNLDFVHEHEDDVDACLGNVERFISQARVVRNRGGAGVRADADIGPLLPQLGVEPTRRRPAADR